jgi:hypothetical protein
MSQNISLPKHKTELNLIEFNFSRNQNDEFRKRCQVGQPEDRLERPSTPDRCPDADRIGIHHLGR